MNDLSFKKPVKIVSVINTTILIIKVYIEHKNTVVTSLPNF